MRRATAFVTALVMLLGLFAFDVNHVSASEWTNYNFRNASRNNDAWFGSAEGRRVADAIVRYQHHGGWRDDMAVPSSGNWGNPTLDNDATTSHIIILARAYLANGTAAYRTAMNRGLDLLFDGQLQSGGWPKIFNTPAHRVTTYHRHVTFNDNSSVNAGRIMLDIAENRGHFAGIVDSARRTRATQALDRFVLCILNSQVRNANGRLAAWPQQAHYSTLRPEWGREFEPPAISGSESAGIIRFLRDLPNRLRCQRVADAHNYAVRWYRDTEIFGIRVEQSSDDRWIVNAPGARDLWPRLSRISDNVPIFGDRAAHRPPGVNYRLNLSDISQERRRGYSWYGNWGRDIRGLSNISPYAPLPPLQGTLIRDLVRLDTQHASHWSIQQNAQVGDEIFGCHRTFAFTALPAALRGSEWLRMSGQSKYPTGNLATFYARENITVHIGLDSRVVGLHGLPSFLNGWTRQAALDARTHDGTRNIYFEMYTRNFNSGQRVTLGSMAPGTNVMMYTAFITPREEPRFSISLSRTGTHTFPSAMVGFDQQNAIEVTITNTGNRATGPLTVAGPVGFTIGGTTGLAAGVEPGATHVFTINPSRGVNGVPGVHTGAVSVTGGNSISAQFNVSFTVTAPPAVMRTDGFYTIRSQHSSRYLEADGTGSAANVQQGGTIGNFAPNTTWELRPAADGFFFIHSLLGEGNYVIDVPYGRVDNGESIRLWEHLGGHPQQFMFVRNANGTYRILTRATNGASALDVHELSMERGGNIVQWAVTGAANQNWYMQFHEWAELPCLGCNECAECCEGAECTGCDYVGCPFEPPCPPNCDCEICDPPIPPTPICGEDGYECGECELCAPPTPICGEDGYECGDCEICAPPTPVCGEDGYQCGDCEICTPPTPICGEDGYECGECELCAPPTPICGEDGYECGDCEICTPPTPVCGEDGYECGDCELCTPPCCEDGDCEECNPPQPPCCEDGDCEECNPPPPPCADCGNIECTCGELDIEFDTSEIVILADEDADEYERLQIDEYGYLPRANNATFRHVGHADGNVRFVGWYTDPAVPATRWNGNNGSYIGRIILRPRWTAPIPDFRLGNTTPEEDDRITSADTTRIAQMIRDRGTIRLSPDSDLEELAADINGDGYICMKDLVLHARWLVGQDVFYERAAS